MTQKPLTHDGTAGLYAVSLQLMEQRGVFDDVHGEGLLLVPVLVGVAIIVKIVPSLMFTKEHGVRNTMATGLLLSARLSLLIAAINIGIKAGIQDVIDYAPSLIILALIMCILAPIGFKYLYTPPEGLEDAEEVEPTYDLMLMEGD